MNAIDLLESQHREIDQLFSRIEKAKDSRVKRRAFEELADQLAAHAAIEEHQFYPAVKARRTEDILLESLEEHLGIKRVLADLLETRPADATFDAKLKVLKEQVQHHVGEEEGDLFPKVKKILDDEQLEALGQEMTAEQSALASDHPWKSVLAETGRAAPL
jgi:hemerythrin superfamily protein